MPNTTFSFANSDLNLFSSSALNADIVQDFTPVKEFNSKELTAVFSFPKEAEAVENIEVEEKYTAHEQYAFFSLLNEVVIKDVSQKKKKLWGLFGGLDISEEEIENAKKSLFAPSF